VLAASAALAAPPAGDIVVASWNIENLFDAEDDPDNPGDDEFTASNWRRWTEARYRLKLTNCADIISMMKPDVLVLAEVENKRVLKDLCEVLDNVFHYRMPYIIHRDSTDPRGIDVAMLARIKPAQTTWIRPGTGLRDSVAADFKAGGGRFTVIGNHWKSRWGDKKQSDATRSFMASKVKAHWSYLLGKDPAAAIIVKGDFNDDINDPVPREAGGFTTNRAEAVASGEKLFSLSAELPREKKSTYFYSQTKTWHSFDQMNVSRGLLPEGEPASPWYTSPEFFEVFATDKQRQKDYFNAPYPFRRIGTKNGQKILNGYSDHFPVLIRLKARK
jgi:endonuclease/exonuclease/phosphatase family metal-dependent hydrolase